MKTITMIVATLALGAACKKSTDDKPSSMGSATMGSGTGSGSAPAPARTPISQDDVAKRAHECMGFWNGGKWDDLQGCYAKDASYDAPGSGLPTLAGSAAIVELDKADRAAFPDQKGEMQLLLVNGRKALAIMLVTGKNTGGMKAPVGDMPVTNNKMGLYHAQVLAFDDTGKVTHEDDYFDQATELGQLKPAKDHPVRPVMEKLAMPAQEAIAKDDAKEKANLTTFQQLNDHFNKHDTKGLADVIADDVTWSEQAAPKDETKKELLTELPKLWKSFSDLKFAATDVWAAGDFVVAAQSFDGTNDGDLPMLHVKKTGKKVSLPFLAVYKLDGGKVKASWIVYQNAGFAKQLGIAQPVAAKAAAASGAATAKVVEKKK